MSLLALHVLLTSIKAENSSKNPKAHNASPKLVTWIKVPNFINYWTSVKSLEHLFFDIQNRPVTFPLSISFYILGPRQAHWIHKVLWPTAARCNKVGILSSVGCDPGRGA